VGKTLGDNMNIKNIKKGKSEKIDWEAREKELQKVDPKREKYWNEMESSRNLETLLDTRAREFFKKRFNKQPESDPVYFEEWKMRFRSGHPESWMDKESKKVYHSLED
jgi:hypothetical protein